MEKKYERCQICGSKLYRSRQSFPTCFYCSKREGGEDIQSINDYCHADKDGDELSEALEYLEAWE